MTPQQVMTAAGLVALLAASGVKAQDGSVSASLEVDRTVVALDKHVKLAVIVTAPEGTTIEFAPVRDAVGPFDLVYQSEGAVETLGGGRGRWLRSYRIKPTEIGVQTIPPFIVHANLTAEGLATEVASSPLDIFVTPAFAIGDDVRSPRSIAPAASVSPPALPWWWIAAGMALLASLVVAVTTFLRRRGPMADAGAPAPPVHAVALAALAEIRQQGLMDGARSAEFHLRLSQILRSYVVWRFDARALTQTTEEFLATAADIEPLAGERSDLVGRLLAHCDLAKFAGWIPTQAAMTGALDSAERFVSESASNNIFAPRGASLEAP